MAFFYYFYVCDEFGLLRFEWKYWKKKFGPTTF